MLKKNIAIIGGGGAGVVAAWALDKIHNVTIFEAENMLGGHAITSNVAIDEKNIPVDMGVELFTEKQAPNLCALLKYFSIETYVAPLSFTSVYDDNQEFWSNTGNNGQLWYRIKHECNRFHLDMHEVMHKNYDKLKNLTIGEFLYNNKYSQDFIYKALMPLLTTFSSYNAPILEYSLMYCALSFNLGLLSFFNPTYLRKVSGGIGSYINKITSELQGKIYLNCKVQKVIRANNKVIINYNNTNKEFDEVIFATHADIALFLIENPNYYEQKLLGNFEYVDINSILHNDKKILAPNIKSEDRTYCEYNAINRSMYSNVLNGSLTRNINKSENIFVTFDSKMEILDNNIYYYKKWKLPKLRPIDMRVKQQINNIQGKDHLWFCGTDTNFTGHEGAICSGLIIAEQLGAKYPFFDNHLAKIQFDVSKGIMGVYNLAEKINNLWVNSIYSIAKIFKLHQGQISKIMLDLYI